MPQQPRTDQNEGRTDNRCMRICLCLQRTVVKTCARTRSPERTEVTVSTDHINNIPAAHPTPAATGNEDAVVGEVPRFDVLAELFATFAADTDSIYRTWVTAAVPDLADRPGSRAVDLGCGSGRFTDLLADRHNHVLGVDIAARELDLARANHTQPHVRFEHRGLLDVTADRDGQFDTVFTVNTVHHLRAHDIVLPHLRSLVAPGGHLIAVDIVDPGQWRDLDWHIHDAFTDAETSYRHRSQDAGIAADLVRLRLHPAWLDHVTENIPLTRDQFTAFYIAAFPGVEITNLDRVVAAAHWHALV
jgi:2-polyprenyl-3-methyl-5-hydroxy-6-metoxy-1,4-benzoquinol methylase